MSCEDIRNLAVLASFGEASAAEQASVRAHATKCPACAAEVKALGEGVGLLAHVPREVPSEDARAAIGGMLMKEGLRAAPRGGGLRWAAAAAVLVAAVAGAAAWNASRDRKDPVQIVGQDPVRKSDRHVARTPAADPSLDWSFVSDRLDTVASHLSDLRGGRSQTVNATSTDTEFSEGDELDGLYERLDSFSAGIEKL